MTKFTLPLAALVAVGAAAPVSAQEGLDPAAAGKVEYMNACASCHGEDGKGEGPLAGLMTVEVPDLTQIAAQNDGEFPVQEIFMIIDGRTGIRGHGYPMPVWGDRFRAEADETWGPYTLEQIVRGRVLELTYYLQSIQEEAQGG